jgi:hypothetical protein
MQRSRTSTVGLVLALAIVAGCALHRAEHRRHEELVLRPGSGEGEGEGEEAGPFISNEPPVRGVQPFPSAALAVGGSWVAQGPGPILHGPALTLDPAHPTVGAVHTLVAHPLNPDIAWVGATNGGIWRTTNATSPSPHWTPQTDGMPSLSIGALELDPTDATHQTLLAGIGIFSSFGAGSAGGALTGLLRTTNGGTSWTSITDPLLTQSISGVAARGSTLLAAAMAPGGSSGGLLRSTNTGASWTQISGLPLNGLPAGAVFDLVGDPSVPSLLYCAVKGDGIYRTVNTGLNWRKISNSDPVLNQSFTMSGSQEQNNTEMTVASNGRLYVAVLVYGRPVYLGYTDDPTSLSPTWTAMDLLLTPNDQVYVIADASNTTPIVITSQFGSITGASNTAPIVITSLAHGLMTGAWIFVNNVTGNAAANGTFFVTVTDADHFQLNGSAGNGSYTGGGSWYVGHSLAPGTKVEISGVTGNTAANGLFTITFINNNKFSLNGSSRNGAYTGGGTWTTFDGINPDIVAGGQGLIHFSLRVDPADPATIYVGGDHQSSPFPNVFGATSGSEARLFRADASIAPTGSYPSPQWDHLTHSNDAPEFPGGGTASFTAPHPDSREIVLDAAGDLLEVDDGGVFRRTSPQDNTGDWSSLNGDLQTTEFHDIAYDSNTHVIVGGTQDNGTAQQIVPGSLVWDEVGQGDGGDVAVDDTSVAGLSVHYIGSQFLIPFHRTTYDAQNQLVSDVTLALQVVDGPTFSGQFVTPVELNRVDALRLAIGGWSRVYESLDQGETLRTVGTATANWDALAYGGRIGNVPNPDVLYIGQGSKVWIRTTPYPAAPVQSSYAGKTVRDIVLDPDDWRVAYVVDPTDVWRTTNAGAQWTKITGNLVDANLRAIDFAPGQVASIFAAGLQGVWRMRANAPGVWTPFGNGLPHAPVYDLEYDAVDDVLVAGTLGRGAWLLAEATCGGGANDADGDSLCDDSDPCPSDPANTNTDGDPLCDDLDCVPLNSSIWSVPGEVRELRLAHSGGVSGATALSWTAPAQPGGVEVLAYDTIASGNPADFVGAGASCTESNDLGNTASSDSVTPSAGAVRAFLVRAENSCGSGIAGTASDGSERPARSCP